MTVRLCLLMMAGASVLWAGCSDRNKSGQATAATHQPTTQRARAATPAVPDSQPANYENTGPVAPEFTLNDQEGRPVRLADFAGKVVVLEWVNWDCPQVRRLHANARMQTLAEDLAADRDLSVVWLAINSTPSSSQVRNQKAVEEFTLPYRVLDDRAGRVASAYGVTMTPHLFVINGAGQIVYHGAPDDDPNGGNPVKHVNYVEEAIDALAVRERIAVPRTEPYGTKIPQTR